MPITTPVSPARSNSLGASAKQHQPGVVEERRSGNSEGQTLPADDSLGPEHHASDEEHDDRRPQHLDSR